MTHLLGLLLLIGISQCAHSAPALTIFASVPEHARAKVNPSRKHMDPTKAGAKLFTQHCSQCHGQAAEGGKTAPTLISSEMQDATPGELFWVVTNGVLRRGMPSWSKLPPIQRWQIISFLKWMNTVPR